MVFAFIHNFSLVIRIRVQLTYHTLHVWLTSQRPIPDVVPASYNGAGECTREVRYGSDTYGAANTVGIPTDILTVLAST